MCLPSTLLAVQLLINAQALISHSQQQLHTFKDVDILKKDLLKLKTGHQMVKW